jgi:hypothetical protein
MQKQKKASVDYDKKLKTTIQKLNEKTLDTVFNFGSTKNKSKSLSKGGRSRNRKSRRSKNKKNKNNI